MRQGNSRSSAGGAAVAATPPVNRGYAGAQITHSHSFFFRCTNGPSRPFGARSAHLMVYFRGYLSGTPNTVSPFLVLRHIRIWRLWNSSITCPGQSRDCPERDPAHDFLIYSHGTFATKTAFILPEDCPGLANRGCPSSIWVFLRRAGKTANSLHVVQRVFSRRRQLSTGKQQRTRFVHKHIRQNMTTRLYAAMNLARDSSRDL